ncbi:MAG: AraC family transcriptional regulator [Clostridia bacterium]|nr:AraC family transcriptional regulator [Clostridia bacterium]
MSYETERYAFEKLSNQGLSVIECGLQICHSGHSSGKLVYPDYSAHFIIEGKGIYSVNGKNYELCRGQGFMITPDIPNIYIADEAEPWKYIYTSFNGPDAQILVHNAGLNDDIVVFDFPTDEETTGWLWNMHSSGKNRSSKGYDCLGYFLLVMSRLIGANSCQKVDASAEHYMNLALGYIENHFSYGISVGDVADFVGIDRTYLYRIFIEHLGISPSEHISNIRLARAVALMEYAHLTVNEIALSSGFYDLSHFTRVFHRRYGMAPGRYRQSLK